MMEFAGAWAFLFQHPLIGSAIFLAVSAGVIFLLSGGQLIAALGGILRVFITIFTSPFLFLRDALGIVQNAGENEQDYRGSRVFLLFRWSRIQYLGLLLLCLLVLSGGVTTALISLYPQQEMEQGKFAAEQVRQAEANLTTAQQAVAAAGAPNARQALEQRRTAAQSAFQQQMQSDAAYRQSITYTTPIIGQVATINNPDYAVQVRDQIDTYITDCPRGYNYSGMTGADCVQLRAVLVELLNRRIAELNLLRVSNEAEQAYRNADSAAQQANVQLQQAQATLDASKQQQSQVSLFNPNVMGERLKSALGTLISTLLSVVALVWFGAILIDVLNWFILVMRSVEKTQQEKLEAARPPT
ncbi:MAG: hypothetical protein ABUS57_08920 [Pseudomonadota bacterium]